LDARLACNGLPGVPKPGLPRQIAVNSSNLSGFLGLILEDPAAIPITLVVGGVLWDLNQLCGAAQPPDPVLTPQDFVDAVDIGNIVANGNAVNRIRQWFNFMMWPTWCDCADGTAPPAATTSPLPNVGVGSGLPAGPIGATCWDATATISKNTPQEYVFARTFPVTSDLPGWDPASGPAPQRLPTPTPTQVFFTGTRNNTIHPNEFFSCSLLCYDTTGARLVAGDFDGTTTPVNTASRIGGTVVANAGYYWPVVSVIGTLTDPDTATGRVELFCGPSTPTTPLVPCCPPDTSLDTRLRRIEDYERVIIQLLGTAGRALVDGVRHAGLSGGGSLVFTDAALAVRVEIKNLPPSWPQNVQTPPYLFSAGFITPTAEGVAMRGSRLIYESQTFPLDRHATGIDWQLPVGLTIDIVELLPG
jgi:hypothetical protein